MKRINDRIAFDQQTGEKLTKQEVWKKHDQIVKVVDVHSQKNVKHAKFRTARYQRRIYDRLSLDEAGLLLKLLAYMDWETNLIVGDGVFGEKNKPLKWIQVDKIMHCSKPHRIKLVNALEEKGIIGYMVVKKKRVGIVVNPRYAINGYKPAEALLKSFECNEDVFYDQDEE